MRGWGLVIETAGPSCQVGLLEDGQPVGGLVWDWPQQHSERLIELVQNVLHTANLDWGAIRYAVYHQGPGSHTGLRIGLSAVKAWALSLGWAVYPVPLMRVLAWLGRKVAGSDWILGLWETRGGQAYGQLWQGEKAVDSPGLHPLPVWEAQAPAEALVVGNGLLPRRRGLYVSYIRWPWLAACAAEVEPLQDPVAISAITPLYFRPFVPTQRKNP